MKTRKHVSILCLILCFALLLASCNSLTPNIVDTGDASEDSLAGEIIEESSEVLEVPSEEPSEEPSEPDYQVEMTEQMMKEYLKFRGVSYTLEELLDDYEYVYGVENYNYKADCIALGELNGYTLWGMLPGMAKEYAHASQNYIAGDYKFFCRTPDMPVYYCLYKDNEFIFLKDAFEQGLFNPDDAYELIKKNPRLEVTVKKLSELDYQYEMTDEMATEYFKFIGIKETLSEMREIYKNSETRRDLDFNDFYWPIGNLDGYTLCFISSSFPWPNYNSGFFIYYIDGYDFSTGDSGKSDVSLYLYKDNTFITLEDAHEQDLFDVAKAYEMLYNSGCSHARFSDDYDKELKKIAAANVYDYEVEFTEEMANEFLKFNGIDESVTDLTARIIEVEKDMFLKMGYDYRFFYKAFGNLNGYTLCSIGPGMYYPHKIFEKETHIVGGYKFLYCNSGFKSDLEFYLYKDHTYMTIEDAFEQGIATPDDVYKRVRMSKSHRIMQKLEYENLDYEADMNIMMVEDFLHYNEVRKSYSRLMKKLKKNDAMKDYDCNDDYIAVGNLNGNTLCFVNPGFCGLPVKEEGGKYIAGDYEFSSDVTGLKSCVNLYLCGYNIKCTVSGFISFEEAYEQGLFDVEEAYELLCSAGYSDCVRKLK